ncbi:hydrogenase maturation protease [Candidatus Bipolaricaulota bacterium]|nr:hydrogenase maturation protease [Candidatus Bipolaricaulota bacterium]
MKHLVIGWGNPLAGDDGIGPRAAELIANRVPEDVQVCVSSHAGLRLVERMRGYDRVLLADVRIDNHNSELDTTIIHPNELIPLDHSVRHDGSLMEALQVFRSMNDPHLPTEIVIITAPVAAPREWRAELSPSGERAAHQLADALLHQLEVTAVV